MSDDIRLKIEVYVKCLANIITSASLYYDIWWIYREKDSRAKYVNIMNQYLDFFHTSVQSHFLAMVVEIYKLYETRKDTANFPSLVKLVLEHNLMDQNTQVELKNKIKEAKSQWKKVAILRSELFAHRSISSTYEAIYKKTAITPNQIKELIEDSKDLLNFISKPIISTDQTGT
jgi:hypothetical protein